MRRLVRALVRYAVLVSAILAVAWLFSGVRADGLSSAMVAALALGVLNMTLRPVLLLLSFPVNFFTLGAFTFVVNAVLLWLVGAAVEGFEVNGALTTFFAALFISFVSMVADEFLR